MAKTAIQGFQQGLIGRADLRAPVVAFAEPWLQSAASAPSPTRREVVKTHSRDESALCSRVIAELAPGAACAAAATLLGRGLVATRALAPGDAVLSVPARNLLCVGSDPRSGAGAAALQRWQAAHGALPRRLASFLLEGWGELSSFSRLVAWLLWLRHHPPSAVWEDYVSLLPQEGDVSGPLFTWGDAELAELQSPGAAAAAQRHRRVLARMHEGLFRGGGGKLAGLRLAPGGLRDVLWAAGMVSTRMFSLQMGDEAPSMLAPCADLANHSPCPNAVFLYDDDREAMQLLALEDLRPGDEVCLSYGAGRSNADLLKGYGFTLAAATAATAALGSHCEAAAAASGQLDAAAAGGQLGLEALGEELLGRRDPAAVQQRRLLAALASLQPFFGSGAALGHAAGGATCSSSSGGSTSSTSSTSSRQATLPVLPSAERQRERRAAELLRAQCLQLLADMPTSLAEDEAALAAAGTAAGAAAQQLAQHGRYKQRRRQRHIPNVRAAVAARAERKRLLFTLCDVLTRYCDALG